MAIGTKSVTGNSSLRNIEGSLVVSEFMAPSGESYLFSPGMIPIEGKLWWTEW